MIVKTIRINLTYFVEGLKVTDSGPAIGDHMANFRSNVFYGEIIKKLIKTNIGVFLERNVFY